MTWSISPAIAFSFFYWLVAFCFVVSPTEFQSAGFTIQSLFSSWLGSEMMNFVQYHIRRTATTVIFHASLPLGELLLTLHFIYNSQYCIQHINIGFCFVFHRVLHWNDIRWWIRTRLSRNLRMGNPHWLANLLLCGSRNFSWCLNVGVLLVHERLDQPSSRPKFVPILTILERACHDDKRRVQKYWQIYKWS